MKRLEFIFCILLVSVVCSCKTKYIHETTYGGYNKIYNMNPGAPTYHIGGHIVPQWALSGYGAEKSGNQKVAIIDLEKMITDHPNEQKYKDALDEYKDKLYGEYRKRVGDRMVFLREFYSDMYKLSNKDFTKKYKKHCDKELVRYMDKVNFDNNKIEGNHWFVFSDLENHKSDDFKFQYMDGDPKRVGNSSLSLALYKDSVKHKTAKYKLHDAEDKWYKVSMGENYAMVKVEGEDSNIKITEVINPSIPFVHRAAKYDRKPICVSREDHGDFY